MARLTNLKDIQLKNTIEKIIKEEITILNRKDIIGSSNFYDEIELTFKIAKYSLHCEIILTTGECILGHYLIDYLLKNKNVKDFTYELEEEILKLIN